MSDNIPAPTVQQLVRELNDVDWYLLGVALGLSVAKLRRIQSSDSQSGVQHWKIDMFQSWLDSSPTASWPDVIKALEQLDHAVLAARLRTVYTGPQLPATTESSARHLTSAPGAVFEANEEVVRRLQCLEGSFSSMLTNIRQFYVNCDLAAMQFFLNDLLETEEFLKCATFDGILRQLRQGHMDTFNIHCLEQFAHHFQRDEVDELIDKYKMEKESFLTETVVTEFQQAIVSRVGPILSSKKAVITIKIPASLASKRTLNDMERLAGRAFGKFDKSLVNLRAIPASCHYESEESMRDQTSLILYEFLDEKSNDDSELTESERSRLHNTASSHIREIRARQGYGQEQVDPTSVIASDLKRYADEFNLRFLRDPEFREAVQSSMEDTDGQPNVESVINHLSDVVVRVFECDENGVAQNVSLGRVAAVFSYCYTVCKTYVKRVGDSGTNLLTFLAILAVNLISTLIKTRFFDWLVEQGGWYQMVGSMMPRVPAWGNNLLLVGAVLLGGMWVYRTYFGGN